MNRNILIGFSIIALIWIFYPIVHITKVKWSEDLIEYAAPSGYVNDVSELNETKIQQKITLESELNAAISQLDSLMFYAKKNNHSISIVGKKHSMGGQTIFQNGVYLSLENINHLELDHDEDILTIGSGCTWIDAIYYLNQYKKSVHVMQSFSDFSIGGSISVNAHGWHPGAGPVGNTIVELLVYTPDQGLMKCSSHFNKELFSLVIGGYGLFGIILEAKIRIIDNVDLKYSLHIMNAGEYVDYYKKNISRNTKVNLVYGRLNVSPDDFLNEATLNVYEVASFKSIISDLEYQPNEFKRIVFRSSVRSNYGKNLRWFLEKNVNPILSKNLNTRNAVLDDRSDLIKNKHQESVDILHEYFIPDRNANKFIEGLKKILPDSTIDLLNVTIREVASDRVSKMPYARENVFGFVMLFNQKKTNNQEEAMVRLTQELIDLTHKLNGVYYLPYRLHATNEQFHKQYPMATDAFKLKSKYDSYGILSNKLFDKYNIAN